MSNEILWYRQPAASFDEALPLGNGRLGAMVYGRLSEDIIGLNEDSVWSGGPRTRNNPNSISNIPTIRELLLAGKASEAEKLAMDACSGVTPNCRHYMPLCDLKFFFSTNPDDTSDYRRELSLSSATSAVTFSQNGITYKREYFISAVDNVLVCHFTADQPGAISFRCCLDGRDDYYDDNRPMNGNTIFLTGGSGGKDGICFASALKMTSEGGKATSIGMYLSAEGCDEVTLFFSTRTNYYSEDYIMKAICDVDSASAKGFEALYEDHLCDYQELYFRSELHIEGDDLSLIPTDVAIKKLSEDSISDYNSLSEMYFNYGKYLMISGSRIGTLPLNLQGIWNKDMWPAWGGRFTININTEMNYWPVEICNLSECHMPLFELIEKMREPGRITAQTMYDCRGFVAHHNTDLWGDCAPQDFWIPATIWPMGAAWLCLHIYEHYRFTQDLEFLSERYPAMKEAALFFTEYLFEDNDGHLVTGPSVSPENVYKLSDGTTASICMGPSMDSEIIYELFSNCIEASGLLDRDHEFAATLREMRSRLAPLKIGKFGQIQEWAVDYDEVEIGHRHISQLFALYPSSQITPSQTPELAAAARATLERRLAHGGGHTGWSRAWIINFWARLLDGKKAGENIRLLLSRSTNPNMLDSHPPFQIDGNFGGTAGIAECIVQSQNHEIYLLPALPSEWKSGYISSIRARGGFEVSLSWRDGRLVDGEILSLTGKTCTVRCRQSITILSEDVPVPTNASGECYTFYTEKNKRYSIVSND